MVSEEQLKAVEYLATGYTIPQTASEINVEAQTIRGWLKNNVEVVQELANATDTFQKACLKGRSRAYRQITKGITDKILEKMEADGLKDYTIDDLIKMLNKSVITMREDENVTKNPGIGIQNNIQINNNVTKKLQDAEFVSRFGDLLTDMDPEDIQSVVESKNKADERNARK